MDSKENRKLAKDVMILFWELLSMLPSIIIFLLVVYFEKKVTKTKHLLDFHQRMDENNWRGLSKIISFIIYVIGLMFILTYGVSSNTV